MLMFFGLWVKVRKKKKDDNFFGIIIKYVLNYLEVLNK